MNSSQDPLPDDGDRPPSSSLPPFHPPVRRPRATDQVLSITGFACAAVAVLFLPVLFGLAGVALGVAGHTRGEPLGRWAAIAAGVATFLGTVSSILLNPR